MDQTETNHEVTEEVKEAVEQAATGSLVDDIMMGGYDPDKVDPTDEWSEEDRKKIAEMMRQLEPKPEPVKANLREHFVPGQIIRDPNGLSLAIRTVGSEAMNVEVIGKKGKFVDGYEVNISGFLFVTTRSRKNKSVFQLYGIQTPPAQEAAPPKEEASTMTQGGNDGETEPK